MESHNRNKLVGIAVCGLAILGLIGVTGVLGYLAISVPEGSGFGNMTFLLIMVALTLVGPAAAADRSMSRAVAAVSRVVP